MKEESKIYTQDEVDDLRRQWESAAFEFKTKEVLDQINRRLDESNNYKATIGKDIKIALTRLDKMEGDRNVDEQSVFNRHAWIKDWWIRAGIFSAMCYEVISIAHTVGWIK